MSAPKANTPPEQPSSLWKHAADLAGAIWRIPKTPQGWLKYAGSALGDYAIAREKKRWENLTHGFGSMDSRFLAKGAGDLIADWMQVQREVPVEAHLSRLEAIVLALDETGHSPLEKAITRFIASKAALHLEGYTSKLGEPTSRYQRYQKQAKVLLSAMPMKNYRGLSQKEIFLGTPFYPESVFMASHRFLDAASVEQDTEQLQAFLTQWGEKPSSEPAAFYARLLALTYRQDDPETLNQVFENWFESYRQFMLKRVEGREKWVKRGFGLVSGQWLPSK